MIDIGHSTLVIVLDFSVPRGSVLGPLKCIAYTENEVDTIKQHNANLHLYADDTQLYACCHPHNIVDTVVSAHLNGLLNMVCFSSTVVAECWQDGSDFWAQSTKLQHHDVTMTMGIETIQPVDVVRNLNVWMDHELSMKQHVIKVAAQTSTTNSATCRP